MFAPNGPPLPMIGSSPSPTGGNAATLLLAPPIGKNLPGPPLMRLPPWSRVPILLPSTSSGWPLPQLPADLGPKISQWVVSMHQSPSLPRSARGRPCECRTVLPSVPARPVAPIGPRSPCRPWGPWTTPALIRLPSDRPMISSPATMPALTMSAIFLGLAGGALHGLRLSDCCLMGRVRLRLGRRPVEVAPRPGHPASHFCVAIWGQST